MNKQQFAEAVLDLASKNWNKTPPLCIFDNDKCDYLWLRHSIIFMSANNEYDVGSCKVITQTGNSISAEDVALEIKTAFRPREMSQINVYWSEYGRHEIEFTLFHKGNIYKGFIRATPEICKFLDNEEKTAIAI